MAYEVFDSEILHIIGNAMDEAWRRVKLNHLKGDANAVRSVLASHIFAMARQGERNPQRLIDGASVRRQVRFDSLPLLSLGQNRFLRTIPIPHEPNYDRARSALVNLKEKQHTASFAYWRKDQLLSQGPLLWRRLVASC
jgi:hypothetical protein